MAYPAGVTTCNLVAGTAINPFGDDAVISMTVTPNFGTLAKRIIHGATGTIMAAFPKTYTSSLGGSVIVPVPHVNQSGWLNSLGQAYTMWSYDLTIQIESGTNNRVTYSQTVQPVVGQTSIDIDLLPDGTGVASPISSVIPAVTSVNGQTGNVTVSGGGSSLPSGGTAAKYLAGDVTWKTLDKSAVGLGNVDNTSDINKPISNLQQVALDAKADEVDLISGLAAKADDTAVLKLNGDQTKTGVLTFSAPPKSITPAVSNDLATKGYVDTVLATGTPGGGTSVAPSLQTSGGGVGTLHTAASSNNTTMNITEFSTALVVGDVLAVNAVFQNAASTDGDITVTNAGTPVTFLKPGDAIPTTARVGKWLLYPITNAAALTAITGTLTFTTNKAAGRVVLKPYKIKDARLSGIPDVSGAWVAQVGTSATVTLTGLTTDEDKCLILGHIHAAHSSPTLAPSTMTTDLVGDTTEFNSVYATGTLPQSSTTLAHFAYTKATAGVVPAVVVTFDTAAASICGYMFALAPAVAGAAPTITELNTRLTAAEADIDALQAGGGGGGTTTVSVSELGIIPVASYAGINDVARMTSALADAAAAAHSGGAYKRSLWLDARQWDLRGLGTIAPFDGLSILGPGGGRGREFRETNRILTNPAGFIGKPNGARDVFLKGLSFENTGWHLEPFPTDNSLGDHEDWTIEDCGFQGGQFWQGTFTRVNISSVYINGQTGTALKAGGSDCRFFMDGDSYLSCINTGFADNVPLISIGMNYTEIGPIYCTPQGGYGLEVTYSKGGLIFHGIKFDSNLRSNIYATSLAAPPGAAAMIKVKGSAQNVVFNNPMCFNGNALGVSLANMFEFTTTGHDHVIDTPRWNYDFAGQVADHPTGPALYTSGARVMVKSPNWNIGASGATRTMRQLTAGCIHLVSDWSSPYNTNITTG